MDYLLKKKLRGTDINKKEDKHFEQGRNGNLSVWEEPRIFNLFEYDFCHQR